MTDNIIAGLDIGSTNIRLVVGQIGHSQDNNQLRIIGAVEQESSGINKGIVNSIEDITSSISACLDKAERLMGIPIDSAWVGINSSHIRCERSKGVVAVSKSDGEITEDDIERVIEASRALSMPPNYQILHVIPIRFTVDNQDDIKDPIGMTGVRLEVEALIIHGATSEINNLTKAIYRTGLDIEDLVLSPMCASVAVMDTKQKELGSVLINIGATTTSMAVFEERELIHVAVLRIGSEDITKDLAIGLRCPIKIAERIKYEYGTTNTKQFNKKDKVHHKGMINGKAREDGLGHEIDITDIVEGHEDQIEAINPINRKYIAEIIEARVEEIFEKVDKELKKINRSGMLPAGAFLIGNGIKLDGILEVAKNKLRIPVCIGSNNTVEAVIGKVNDPRFLTALGLVVWGSQETPKKQGLGFNKIGGGIKDSVGKVTNWFKSLMP